jgi:hypothetical protein
MMIGKVLYVYAVVPANASLEAIVGLDGAPIRTIARRDLSVVVHDMDSARPYAGAEAQVRQWIAEHARVVDAAWNAAGTVLPMTFNVLARGDATRTADEAIADWLDRYSPALLARLEQLRDRVELKVEITVRIGDAAAGDAEVGRLREQLTQTSAGLRRLRERQLEQVERRIAEHSADALYPDVRRRLAGVSENIVEQVRTRAPSGHVQVFSAALLVSRARIDDVGLELAALQEASATIDIRFLGPWPPYSFATVPPPDGSHGGPSTDREAAAAALSDPRTEARDL